MAGFEEYYKEIDKCKDKLIFTHNEMEKYSKEKIRFAIITGIVVGFGLGCVFCMILSKALH